MWDQVGFAGFLGLLVSERVRGVAGAGMAAAWQGFLDGAIRFDEFLGRTIGPRLANFMIALVVLIAGLLYGSHYVDQHVVLPYNRQFSIHGSVVTMALVGMGAIGLYALFQHFIAHRRSRAVSYTKSCLLIVGVPATLAVVEFVDAGLTGSGWHFTIAVGFALVAVLTLAVCVMVAAYVFQKAVEASETTLVLVGEPVATILPGTTRENVRERTQKLFDLVREEYWALKMRGLAPALAAALIPYFAIASWWINAKFFGWLAVSYFTMIALAWVAIYRFLDEEILKGQQGFIRWMMALFIPMRVFLHFAGNPYMWEDRPLIGVSGYGLIIVVGLVSLAALSILLKGITKSGMFRKLLAGLAVATLGWAVMAFYIKAEGYRGWSPGYGFHGTPTESKRMAKADTDGSEPATPQPLFTVVTPPPVIPPPPPVVVNTLPPKSTTPAPRQASKRHSSHRAPKPMSTQEAEDRVNQMIKARGLTIPED